MAYARAPWWMYLLAGAFITFYVVMVYSELYEPRRIGFTCEFRDEKAVVAEVTSHSPAGRAGVKSGDRLLAIDGADVRQWQDWSGFLATREIGRSYRFKAERAGQAFGFNLTPGRISGDPLGRLERKRYVQFILLLVALMLAFREPRVLSVQIGALLLAAVGTAPLFPGMEMTAVWRNLPIVLGAALWIPQATHLLLLPLFFTFFAVFPNCLFRQRWPWLIVWGPAVIVAGWHVPQIFRGIYRPTGSGWASGELCLVLGLAVLVYGGGALGALVMNCRRTSEPEQRRLMRVLVAGAFIGLIPTLLFLVALFWGTLTRSAIVWFFVSTPYKLAALGLFLVFPLSFVYVLARGKPLNRPENSRS